MPPPKKRAKSDADVSTNGYDTRNPKIDNNLDTTGLAVFYNQFQPKNMSEKLLVLAKYLIEKLKIKNPNVDQFYTCMRILKEKAPADMAKAFHNAQLSQYGYLEYNSPSDISITVIGHNHFDHDLPRNS